jgi:hypothetical protein
MDDQYLHSDAQFAAYGSSIARDKSILARNKELSNALHRIHENYMKEMKNILGSKFNEYKSLRQKIRDRALSIRPLLIATPEGEKVRKEFQRISSSETRKFINSLGMGSENVKAIQKKYRAEATAAVEKTMNLADPGTYVDVHSPDLENVTDNPWTYRSPPYDGSSGYELKDYDGFGGHSDELAVSHFESASTAEIGCKSFIGISYAYSEEDSYCHTTAGSDIWISFLMPTTGLVEVYVDLQSIETTYHGSIYDGFGFSDIDLYQKSRVYLEEVRPEGQTPERRYEGLLDYRRDDEGSWSGDVAWPGNYLYPHLFSMHPYAAGQLVTLKIGIEDEQYVDMNDMSSYSFLTNRWFVSRVAVRSSGQESPT